jgi:hypothetical protein
MKRLLAYFVLIVLLLVLGISSSEQAMRWISKARYQKEGIFGSDKYRFGDLYGLTYLSDFRIEKNNALLEKQYQLDHSRDIDLYILGDSYLFSYIQMDTSNFARSKQVVFRKWSDGDSAPIEIHPSKRKKVLLVETVQRNVWTVIDLLRVRSHLEGYQIPLTWNESLNATLTDAIYDANLEQNIDFTLFDFQAFSPLKSLKSQWNWSIFGRTEQDVVLSKDHQYLYMKETVDSLQKGSSFYPVRADEVYELSARMASIQKYAISRGFDEVVFSFIPNPVSFTQTEGRIDNQLNQKLIDANRGRFHFLDPTPVLLKGGKQYFFQSDSHWNQMGAKQWLGQLNQYLLLL